MFTFNVSENNAKIAISGIGPDENMKSTNVHATASKMFIN